MKALCVDRKTRLRQHPKTTVSNFMIRFVLHSASVLAIAVLLVSPVSQAQPQSEETTTELSSKEIEKVASLLIKLEDLRGTYKEKIRSAEDPEQIRAYKRQLTIKIDGTIERHDGMSIKRYEEIMDAAQSDADLKRTILRRKKEKQGKTTYLP